MLGSAALRVFGETSEVFAAVRSKEELDSVRLTASRLGIDTCHLLLGFDARQPESVIPLIEASSPDIIFNATGIISQQGSSVDARLMIEVNSVWPQALAQICEECAIRLIHISTDCVFSGRQGNYSEKDVPDATDIYGRSKLLGEVTDSANVLTLRTSIIGWQFGPQISLVGWFASHRDQPLRGYTNAIFSGLPTTSLCKAIRDYVLPKKDLQGLYHISVAPIDKHQLLCRLAQKMGWTVDISPDDSVRVNKSLDSSRFRVATSWEPPSWDALLTDLAADYAHYYSEDSKR